MTEHARDFVGELLARRAADPAAPASGEVLDLAETGFVATEDPAHDLNEELRRNAEGGDPAPHIGDEAFWAEWTRQREAENA